MTPDIVWTFAIGFILGMAFMLFLIGAISKLPDDGGW
jgi:hypothetical protein